MVSRPRSITRMEMRSEFACHSVSRRVSHMETTYSTQYDSATHN
jgi:hypothetical protein